MNDIMNEGQNKNESHSFTISKINGEPAMNQAQCQKTTLHQKNKHAKLKKT